MLAEVVPLSRGRELREARVHAAEEPRLTTEELCEVLKVSPSTVKRWRKAGMPFEAWSPRLYRYQLSLVMSWRAGRFGA